VCSQVHGKSKLKKAFCEPKNISFCPPIAVASAFAFGMERDAKGELTITRSPENGGDVVFHNQSELEASFAAEELHPGDLKSAASALAVKTLEKLAASMKEDPEAAKAAKTLKALAKKLAQSKDKK
jgi:tyrosyl-tRNA synthetase